jgi:hypothetical protein
MMTAMRTIIELPGDQLEDLAKLCETEGISRAEAIRRAIADYIRPRRGKGAAAAFGLWRGRPIDALDYERALRNDWERAPAAAARRPRGRR